MDALICNPTAKVIRTLQLIQSRHGITALELAERLEVTDRAVRRYVAILREAGVAVESARGRNGGYRIGRSLQPPPIVFTATEALGLVMAVLDGHHAAADDDDPVGSALGKLMQSLPATTARRAAAVRAHALAAPDRGAARPDPSTTSTLVDAVATRRGARIGYTTEAGRAIDAVVDPWAVVVRHGRWYLLCFAHHANAPRTYRMDRIDRVDVLNVEVEPPDDLDPVAALEANLAAGWRYETLVEFAAPLADVAHHVWSVMGRLEPLDEGRCLLRGTTENPTMYAGEWLARIPYPFVVRGGPELSEAVATVGRRLMEAAVSPA